MDSSSRVNAMATRLSKVAEDYSLEAQLRRGFEIIEKAVDERLKTALADVTTWKDLANSRQVQLQTLTVDLGKAQDSVAVMEKRILLLEAENKALRTSKTTLQTKYNTLKRTSIQLEKFRSVRILKLLFFSLKNTTDLNSLNIIDIPLQSAVVIL